MPADGATAARSMSGTGAGAAANPIDSVSAARLALVVPALASRVERVMVALHALGHPVRVTAGWRTQAEQDKLWAQGRTTPGPIVTWTRTSQHLKGRAVDVVWKVDGPGGVSWDGPWPLFGAMAESVGLVWGGRWSPPDRCHVELPATLGDED